MLHVLSELEELKANWSIQMCPKYTLIKYSIENTET